MDSCPKKRYGSESVNTMAFVGFYRLSCIPEVETTARAIVGPSLSTKYRSRVSHAVRLCRRRREAKCCIRPLASGFRNVTKRRSLVKWPRPIGLS